MFSFLTAKNARTSSLAGFILPLSTDLRLSLAWRQVLYARWSCGGEEHILLLVPWSSVVTVHRLSLIRLETAVERKRIHSGFKLTVLHQDGLLGYLKHLTGKDQQGEMEQILNKIQS